jgi:hypothetical protein
MTDKHVTETAKADPLAKLREVVKTAEAAQAVTAQGDSYADMAGAGMEGVDASDQLIPFLRILHYACPQVTEGDPAYIDGARPGMILNTATGEILDGKAGGLFIPVSRDHTFVEYVPRDAGGGFVGVWPLSDPRIAQMKAKQGNFGKLVTANSNELSETFSLYGLFLPHGSTEVWRVVVGFTSTQIKKYKMLTTRLVGLLGTPPKYPMWAFKWQLASQPESNKKGKFFGYRFTLFDGSPATAMMKPNDPLVTAAHAFYTQVRAGEAQANYDGVEAEGSSSEGVDDADIPF